MPPNCVFPMMMMIMMMIGEEYRGIIAARTSKKGEKTLICSHSGSSLAKLVLFLRQQRNWCQHLQSSQASRLSGWSRTLLCHDSSSGSRSYAIELNGAQSKTCAMRRPELDRVHETDLHACRNPALCWLSCTLMVARSWLSYRSNRYRHRRRCCRVARTSHLRCIPPSRAELWWCWLDSVHSSCSCVCVCVRGKRS